MNIKYFLPAIIVAIIIAIFSTILPAQGGFPKSNPSTLTGAYVQVQHSTGTTGVLLDSLKNTTAVGISDGDKTDVDVTGNGTMWTIDTSAINWTKLTQAVKDSITQDLSNFIIQNKTGFFTYTKPSGDIIYQSYTPILYTGVNPATIGGSTTTYMYAVDTIGTDTIYVNNNNVWERFEVEAAAGLDSVTYVEDSVFVWSGGNRYLSGMDQKTTTIGGPTFYVNPAIGDTIGNELIIPFDTPGAWTLSSATINGNGLNIDAGYGYGEQSIATSIGKMYSVYINVTAISNFTRISVNGTQVLQVGGTGVKTVNFVASATTTTIRITGLYSSGGIISNISVKERFYEASIINLKSQNNQFSFKMYNNNFSIGDSSNYNLLGSINLSIGHSALKSLTTGYDNIAIGYRSLWNGTSCGGNIAIGRNALEKTTTSGGNIAIGQFSSPSLTGASAFNNTTIGHFSCGINSGSNNVIVGTNAGNSFGHTSYNNCVLIGQDARASKSVSVNQIVIGKGITAIGDSTTVIGSAMKQVRLGDNLTFKTNQTFGSGDNGKVLAYNHTNGQFEATAIVAGSPRPDTIEATIYHTAVGSTIQVGTSEFFQAVPSEWNGGVITKVHYQQFVTGANVTNVGLKITANGGGVTTPFTGSIAIGDKYKTVTGSTSLATGDAIQVDVPSGTPDGQGLVAVLKIVMP